MAVDDGEQQEADQIPAVEVSNDYDPSMRFVAVFPVRPELGAVASSTVYYIIEPGCHTGLHAENAEEIVYVFEGEGEAFVAGTQQRLVGGEFVVFPAGVQHDVYAYGATALRFVSFYPASLMVSTFQQMILPFGTNQFTSNPLADLGPEGS